MGNEREAEARHVEDTLNGERFQLLPHRISWHSNEKWSAPGMSVSRYIVEKYIPANGFYFAFGKDDSVYHLPIDQSGTAGGS